MTPSPTSASPREGDRSPLVITIDGPAGTGKSSVARVLAERLGLDHLDTGAMYRAAALLTAEHGLDPEDGPAIAAVVREAGMQFDWTTDPPRLLVGGRDVGDRIRDLDVGRLVSRIAAQAAVREVLSHWQRMIAAEHPRLVTEGRDQGSAVFPDADVRFYLDADTDVRADRRVRQLTEAGRTVDVDAVREDIRRRDEQDRGRIDAPLVRPAGAVLVDSSHRTLEEVVAVMVAVVENVVSGGELRSHGDGDGDGDGGDAGAAGVAGP